MTEREVAEVPAKASMLARPWPWLVLAATLVLVPVGRAIATGAPASPELSSDILLPLPAFELVNERGERVTRDSMRGSVWIVSFIFTSCPSVCPKLTSRMASIQGNTGAFGQRLKLVSITVDPDNDTPEVLARYAERAGADPSRWSFWTGSVDGIGETVVTGFKTMMRKEETSPGLFEIVHGERFVLVDQEGNLRGFYEATDAGQAALVRDAAQLLSR